MDTTRQIRLQVVREWLATIDDESLARCIGVSDADAQLLVVAEIGRRVTKLTPAAASAAWVAARSATFD